ncbi:preprotein translocase subunit SecE [candidate division KSB1 bacterium]|nr:preprotein translocase subunit SecE [candidate division KSB1 bacterium]
MFQKAADFIKEIRTEMAKVSWPNREELKVSTITVLLLSVFFSVFIYFADRILAEVIKLIYPY